MKASTSATEERRGATGLVFISQVYPPDPAAVGQHVHDAAREMVRRGWRVIVLTSARGYVDPSRRYLRREQRDGVEIRRLAWGSFGKASLAARMAGGMWFLVNAVARGLWVRRLAGVVVSTSPPTAPVAGRVLAAMRRVPLYLWLMDLNPDQALATGALVPRDWSVRLLERGIGNAARASLAVVVLDRFMADRIERKWTLQDKLTVLPPWPHEEHVRPIAHRENPFRARHDLHGKRVVMYSGNLSPVHPLDTILQAARELREDPNLIFVFIGAGGQRASVEAAVERDGLGNVRLLPYQALSELRYSLSAADVHLVSMGANMVGIVHPCKVYGAMAAARPLLYLGPRRSHVGELVNRFDIGWQIEHGDVAGAVRLLREISAMPEAELAVRGRRAAAAVATEFSQAHLLSTFCDLLERGLAEGAAR